MGLKMRWVMLTFGSVVPTCLFVLIPKVAAADTPHSLKDKSMIETATAVLTHVEAEIQQPAIAPTPPVFRYERTSVSSVPSSSETHQTDVSLDGAIDTESGDRPIDQGAISSGTDVSESVAQSPADPAPSTEADDNVPEVPQPDVNTAPSNQDSPTEPDVDPLDTNPVHSAPTNSAPTASEPVDLNQSEPEATDSDPSTPDPSGSDQIDDAQDEATTENTDDESLETDGDADSEADAIADETSDEPSEEYLRWQQLLIEGDRFFMQGQYLEAEQRYQEAKDPDNDDLDPIERPEAFTDPALLSPAGRVYWREYQAGLESGMETRIYVPLELLTEEYPEFTPAQIEYALLLAESDDDEAKADAIEQLEQATALFPDNADLARARVDFLANDEQWLQAAIAARQFAVLNPDDPDVSEFQTDADEYQRRFRSRLRGRLTRNAIGNALTGALGFVLTGNLFGPFSAVETTVMMLRGESAVGASIANRAAEELDLIEDEDVVAYVNDIGQELASLAGRDEFEYEFYVVEDNDLNAFALPGGKVFINAGAILKTETEAEFAGLIAHELAHAVLSHGFQMVTSGNLTANVLQFVPYGGYAANLAVLRYSRGMERQADRLGTQLLANSNYAADGLHRLMITLYEESDRRGQFDWLSTHPDTPERIRNIDRLIESNGYNRYAFEGIERHLVIRDRVEQLLREADKLDDDEDITINRPTEDDADTHDSGSNGPDANGSDINDLDIGEPDASEQDAIELDTSEPSTRESMSEIETEPLE